MTRRGLQEPYFSRPQSAHDYGTDLPTTNSSVPRSTNNHIPRHVLESHQHL